MSKNREEQPAVTHFSDSEKGHREPQTASLKAGFVYRPIFHLLLITIVGFIAYSNTFHVPFTFDDVPNIIENPHIRNISTIPSMFTEFKGPPIAARPLTSATFALNYYLGGLNTTGYHVFNLTVHIINGILLYFLILLTARLIKYEDAKRVRLIAFFSSLLFIAHPIQTESVTYIVSRSVLLSSAFLLLGIMLFVKAVTAERKKILYTAALFLTSLLGMASREEFFIFPFMLVLYDFFFLSKYKLKDVISHYRFYIPVLLTLSYLLYIVLSYDYKEHAGFEVKAVTPIEYLLTQFNVHWTYLRLLILPMNQNLDYDYPITKTLFEFLTVISFVGYAGLWITGIILIKKAPIISFCILWFMMTLAPSSSLIPIKDAIFEHRLYLPMIGFSTIVPVSLIFVTNRLKKRFRKMEKMIIPALALIIIAFSGAAYMRNIIWADEVTLWTDVVDKSPNEMQGYHNLGLAYDHQNKINMALEAYNKAIALSSDVNQSFPYNNRGSIYFRLGQYEKALDDYTRALSINPNFPEAYTNRGNAYDEKGLPDKAIQDYDQAILLDPIYAGAYYNRGIAYSRLGILRNAIADLQKACEMGSKQGCEDSNKLKTRYK